MRNENERFVEMGKRIKARRVSLGMKQMELAERIDISNNHISSIERGIERPGLESFIRICDVLDVTPDYLLLGSMKANDIPKNLHTDNRNFRNRQRSFSSRLHDTNNDAIFRPNPSGPANSPVS